jgi:hypothetical protein
MALIEISGSTCKRRLDALAGLGGTCDCSIELDIAPMELSSRA